MIANGVAISQACIWRICSLTTHSRDCSWCSRHSSWSSCRWQGKPATCELPAFALATRNVLGLGGNSSPCSGQRLHREKQPLACLPGQQAMSRPCAGQQAVLLSSRSLRCRKACGAELSAAKSAGTLLRLAATSCLANALGAASAVWHSLANEHELRRRWTITGFGTLAWAASSRCVEHAVEAG